MPGSRQVRVSLGACSINYRDLLELPRPARRARRGAARPSALLRAHAVEPFDAVEIEVATLFGDDPSE